MKNDNSYNSYQLNNLVNGFCMPNLAYPSRPIFRTNFSTFCLYTYLKLTGSNMPNITATQKSEVIKLARKEISSQVREVKKESAQNRREIANLRRIVAKLQIQLGGGNETVAGKTTAHVSNEAKPRIRFSSKGLSTERKRLGLSADDYGKLVGVSAQSIYNWEREFTRPRKDHLRQIASVRGIGKKEAHARLTKMH